MTTQEKNKAIVLIEQLRLVESELFRLSSKYGVKTVEEFDVFITKGKFSEKEIGNNFFLFDHLIIEKEKIEKQLKSLNVNKENIWTNLQNLLGLPKLSLQT